MRNIFRKSKVSSTRGMRGMLPIKKEHNAMKEENNERFELYIISNDSE